MNEETIVVEYLGKPFELFWSDLWLISQIRELDFGTLSNIEVQNGKIIMIKEREKKLKPRRPEENVIN